MADPHAVVAPAHRRHGLGLLLRLAVAAGMLVLAFRIALPGDGSSLFESLASAWTAPLHRALAWFAAAFALFGVSLATVTLRFQVLLRAVGLAARFGPIFRAYVVANLLTLVLPSGLLSDVYRVADARVDHGRGVEILASVALERVLSLAALGAVVLAALPFLPREGVPAGAPLLLALAGGLVAMSLSVLHPAVNARLRRLAAPISRLSPTLGGAAERSLTAVATLGERRLEVSVAFALSVAAQALPVLAVFALSRPMDSSVAWPWFAGIVPFVTLATLIPISIGGAGVREYLFIGLFGAVGMRPEVALALSLSTLALSLCWGLVGAAFLVWGRRHPAPLVVTPTP